MRRRLWLSWVALALVLTAALVIGSRGTGAPPSEAARVTRITSEIKCPTCRDLSAAESDAATAHAIRDEVAAEVHAGRSDGQIKAAMVARYGRDILLRPSSSGVDLLVWALPVGGFVVAIAALGWAFRRWRRQLSGNEVTEEDRRLVADALGGSRSGS